MPGWMALLRDPRNMREKRGSIGLVNLNAKDETKLLRDVLQTQTLKFFNFVYAVRTT